MTNFKRYKCQNLQLSKVTVLKIVENLKTKRCLVFRICSCQNYFMSEGTVFNNEKFQKIQMSKLKDVKNDKFSKLEMSKVTIIKSKGFQKMTFGKRIS